MDLLLRLTEQEQDPDYMEHCREEYIRQVESEGLEVYYPNDYELFIDLDNNSQIQEFKKAFIIFRREFDSVDKVTATKSKSGEGLHVRVTLKPRYGELDNLKRVTLQSLLGSDPTRELLSYIRCIKGDIHPTLFVEKPGWKLEKVYII